MSSAFSSWEERPEQWLSSSSQRQRHEQAASTSHPTETWIQDQSRFNNGNSAASSPPITQELDQFGIPVHASAASSSRLQDPSQPFRNPEKPTASSSSARLAPSPSRSQSSDHLPSFPSTQVALPVQVQYDLAPLPSSLDPNAVQGEHDDDESIGLLLGPSKRRRGRKDSYSSFGSSVLPPPLINAGARYAANSGSYPSRSGASKIGRTAYPASNHSGAAPSSSRKLPPQYPSQSPHTSSRPRSSALDLDEWLRTSQNPSSFPSQQSVFPASPSLQVIGSLYRQQERSARNAAAYSEAGSHRGRYKTGSVSGLSAGVLSAGPESPRSRRKASAGVSRKMKGANERTQVGTDHPAFMASQELNREAESRTVDSIEEWRAKSASGSSMEAQLAAAASSTSANDLLRNNAARQRRSASIKSREAGSHPELPIPPIPPLPSNLLAASIASTSNHAKRKSTSVDQSLPPAAFVSRPGIEQPPGLRDLLPLSGLGTQEDTPVRRLVRWLAKEHLKSAILPLILLTSILARWIVGRGDWSGRGAAPMFGDFEAQRHWIELTLHLPTSHWYFYDLQYWGLDYPPLTAWISLACGRIARLFPSVRAGFDFETSRGNEDPATVIFMRASVLVCEMLFYVPALALFVSRRLEGRGRRTQAVTLFSILLQPTLILIDHGHFQYNNVMLGFATACFALLYTTLPNPDAGSTSSHRPGVSALHLKNLATDLSRKLSYDYVVAAVFFCLCLSFKQMALYYAPAVFAVMLGRCVGLAFNDPERGLTLFIGLGLAVISTLGLNFLPWLTSFAQIGQVIHRIFPLARGLFEDKVSNIWCFLSVLPIPQRYKLKNVLDVSTLARLSLLTTLVAILPGCLLLYWAASETAKMEMMVAQDTLRHRQSSTEQPTSVAASITSKSARKHKRRSPSIAGSVAGIGVGSEIESLLAGSTSKMLRPPAIEPTRSSRPVASTLPSPAAQMLPYGLLSVSCAFFLFGFQTHEKSILLPLLPMTLLLGAKGDTWGGNLSAKEDWEWAVWFNNMATFSIYPLLKRDGQSLQYFVLCLAWNWFIGNCAIPSNPIRSLQQALLPGRSIIQRLATLTYSAAFILHAAEVFLPMLAPGLQGKIWARYPDIYPVLNVLLTTPCFLLVYGWALLRQGQVGFANGLSPPLGSASKKKKSA